jgi:hypothetical protein
VFEDVDQATVAAATDVTQTPSARRARHEMPVTKTTDFLQARRAYENAALAFGLLAQSLLVAMVSQHDAFTGRLIRALFALRPDLRANVKRSVCIGELDAARAGSATRSAMT